MTLKRIICLVLLLSFFPINSGVSTTDPAKPHGVQYELGGVAHCLYPHGGCTTSPPDGD